MNLEIWLLVSLHFLLPINGRVGGGRGEEITGRSGFVNGPVLNTNTQIQ